jgi:UDP-N-acetylmuramate dehydrogenase
MMVAAQLRPRLIDRLPRVRGRLSENAPLAGVTWFRVGGPAEVMFRPADEQDLAEFLAGAPSDVPITVIGVGSNLLVRDGGVPGVVIRLGRWFVDIRVVEGRRIAAGAGALDLNVAITAREAAIGGLEFLVGVPGTIGGGLRMNAGAYGREMKDIVISARLADRAGNLRTLTNAELGFAYRHSAPADDSIFISALLQGVADDPVAIQKRMSEIDAAREASQPLRSRTGGSTFANPAEPNAEGRKAWQLIEAVGGRGLRIGGAQVSEKHCNFLINTGAATAHDIEALGEELRRRVRERFGVELRWEIRRIGVHAAGGAA